MRSVSVVIPTLITNNNQLGLTLQCIERALENTRISFELIIVETGTDYLEDYADHYIYEEHKTTATKSINRGFKAARGDFVVLLTNDVLVDYLWLECLLECFDKHSDCGISTLATTQHNHSKEEKIAEGIWFSLAMFRNQEEYFDEKFVNSWDDTDFIMRHYLRGLKMYRNYKCLVEHEAGQTASLEPDCESNFIKNRDRFIEKYKDHKDTRIYKILTEGIII